MKQNAFSIIAAIIVIISNVTLTSCSETIGDMADGLVNGIANQIIDPKTTPQYKTVLVYMAGKNDLEGAVTSDLNEMKVGSRQLSGNDNLLVFVCRYKGQSIARFIRESLLAVRRRLWYHRNTEENEYACIAGGG